MNPWAIVVALLVAATTLVPSGSAEHPEHHRCDDEVFFHLCVDVYDLAPGETKVRHLSSPEGDLRAGWVYIIYGGVDGKGTVEVELVRENETVDSFVWTPGFHKGSTMIRETGSHDLVLHNPSNNTTARYAFYYDQSCNCAGKLIPLPGGFVLFNNRLPADSDVTVRFPMIDGWGLRAAAAWLDEDANRASWPHDYQVLNEVRATDQGWLELPFRTEAAGTYYIFLEAQRGASPDSPIRLTPEWVIPEIEEEAPSSGFPALLLALALLVGLARRRRQRSR